VLLLFAVLAAGGWFIVGIARRGPWSIARQSLSKDLTVKTLIQIGLDGAVRKPDETWDTCKRPSLGQESRAFAPCVRVVAVSDTHGHHRRLEMPPGDVFLFAGDWTNGTYTTYKQVDDFNRWLGELPYPHKFVVSGNHDIFDPMDADARSRGADMQQHLTNAVLLNDEQAVIEQGGSELRVYGVPWQPSYGPGFQLPRGQALREKLAAIPTGVDILVTHGPPFRMGDADDPNGNEGDPLLREELPRVRPRLHLFGHFHGGKGLYEQPATTHVNLATVDFQYRLVNHSPWRFIL